VGAVTISLVQCKGRVSWKHFTSKVFVVEEEEESRVPDFDEIDVHFEEIIDCRNN